MKLGNLIFQTFLLAAFAMWFGGFGFYVSFVVPIGTEVLGSSFEQGLITRRATIPLNYFCGIAVAAMFVETLLTWRNSRSPQKQIQFGLVLIILIMLAAEIWLHPQIDAFVDLDTHEIAGDYDQFYFMHRLYLWVSTVQWIAGWGWLFCYVVGKRDHRTERSIAH
jgi:hypothetical protein